MLERHSSQRRRGERGQALLMALAFVAFFGLTIASLLGVADLTGVQHVQTEATASRDSLAEGGGAYAAADAARTDIALSCAPNSTGMLTMQGGDQANYTVNTCSGSGGPGSGGPGSTCLLCILNIAGSASPTTPVLQAQCAQCTGTALLTTGGDVYVNGTIGSSSVQTSLCAGLDGGSGPSVTYANRTLTDTSKSWTTNEWAGLSVLDGTSLTRTVASNTATTLTMTTNWGTTPAAETSYCVLAARIRVVYPGSPTLAAQSFSNCTTCVPTPTFFAPAIADPPVCQSGSVVCGAPATAPGVPMICTGSSSCTPDTPCSSVAGAWSSTAGCSLTFTSTAATLGPGLWNSLTVAGNPATNITLEPGTYVFTGASIPIPGNAAFDVSGNATVTGSNVTLYLACPNYTSGLACSGNGASVSFSGNGSVTIGAPATGQYAGVALLTDPKLLDPGGTSCASSGIQCVYRTSGNGASITGSIDTRSGGTALVGNAAQTINLGRLVTNSLYMTISGHQNNGLSLSGPGGSTGPTSSCGVFDADPVKGTSVLTGPYRSSAVSTGRAVIQTQCLSGGAGTGVVYFNYIP